MSTAPIRSYRDLIVWQRAMVLAVAMYDLTGHFPKSEQFGLTSQMRRAAVSIASNIAEGRNRGTRNDFAHFVRIAYGSGAELETQLLIAKQLSFLKPQDFQQCEELLTETMRMLNSMLRKLKAKS